MAVAYAFNSSTWETGRQISCEFKANLVYTGWVLGQPRLCRDQSPSPSPKRDIFKPCVVVHTCNPNILEADAGDHGFENNLGQPLTLPIFWHKVSLWGSVSRIFLVLRNYLKPLSMSDKCLDTECYLFFSLAIPPLTKERSKKGKNEETILVKKKHKISEHRLCIAS